MGYDFKEGKKRINAIINNKLEVTTQDKIPNDNEFTFENAYHGWVTGIFVDIRDSTSLFSGEDKEKMSKVIRSFTSEVIEILRGDDNQREIGIRGDCVYAIYTSPTNENEYILENKTVFINTYMIMLNRLLSAKGLPNISVGIGMSTDKELVVKAGRKDVGINNKVWIGEAVAKASKLSSLGNKNGYSPLVYSHSSYLSFIDILVKNNPYCDPKSWFNVHYDPEYGIYHDANIVNVQFEKWIADGMPD